MYKLELVTVKDSSRQDTGEYGKLITMILVVTNQGHVSSESFIYYNGNGLVSRLNVR